MAAKHSTSIPSNSASSCRVLILRVLTDSFSKPLSLWPWHPRWVGAEQAFSPGRIIRGPSGRMVRICTIASSVRCRVLPVRLKFLIGFDLAAFKGNRVGMHGMAMKSGLWAERKQTNG